MGLETTPLKLKIREIRLPDPVPTETPAATPASPGIETLTVEDMVVAAGAFWNRLADQGISGSLTATKLQQIFDEATILAARRVVPVLASILGISKSSAIQLMYAKRMEHQKLNYSMWCLCDEEAPLRLTLANLRSAIAEFEEWSVQCNASELGRAVRETPINVENIRGRLLANGAISWNEIQVRSIPLLLDEVLLYGDLYYFSKALACPMGKDNPISQLERKVNLLRTEYGESCARIYLRQFVDEVCSYDVHLLPVVVGLKVQEVQTIPRWSAEGELVTKALSRLERFESLLCEATKKGLLALVESMPLIKGSRSSTVEFIIGAAEEFEALNILPNFLVKVLNDIEPELRFETLNYLLKNPETLNTYRNVKSTVGPGTFTQFALGFGEQAIPGTDETMMSLVNRLAQEGRTRDAAGAVVKTGAELFLDPQRRADIPDLIRLLENWTDSRIYSRYRSAALEGRADEAQFYLKLGEGIWEGKQLSNALRRIDSVSDDQISAFAKITDFRALIRAVYSVNAASAGTEASTREMPAATSTIQWQDMLFRQLGDNPLDQQRAKEAYQVLQAIDAERSLNYVWREYSEVLGSFCGLVLEFKTASALRQLLSTPTFMASFLDILSQDEALARKVMERLKEVPSRNPHKVVADILRDGKAQFETVSPSEPPTDSIVPAAVVGPSYQVRHVVVVGGNLGGKNGEKMRQTFPELKISHYPADSGSAFSGKNISADTLVIFHIPGLGHSRMLRIEPQCRNAGALVAICPQPGVTSLINLIRHKLGIAAEAS